MQNTAMKVPMSLFRVIVMYFTVMKIVSATQSYDQGVYCKEDGSECFKLSKVGKSCIYPISDGMVCKMVAEAKIFKGSTYVNLTGEGHDMPYGCILDTLPRPYENGLNWLYWNPEGVAISRDENIRQICFSAKMCDIVNTASSNQRMAGGPDACIARPHSKPWAVRFAEKDHPHVVVIHRPASPKFPYGTLCGGTLISKNLVLTAAHCEINDQHVAMVGEHDVEDRNDQQIIGIENNLAYPFDKDDIWGVQILLYIEGTYDIVPDVPILEKIIIDVTNSSLSEVKIQYEGKRFRLDNSKDYAILGIKMQPRDKSHENYVISKTNYIETEDCFEIYNGSAKYCNSSFTEEINWMLRNETTKNNLTVKGIAPISRSPPLGDFTKRLGFDCHPRKRMAETHLHGAKFMCLWTPECHMFFYSDNETNEGETFYWCDSTASIQASTTGSVLYTKNTVTGWQDFSIIVLNRTVEFDEKVSAIKLPKEKESCPQGENMAISGWGLTWLEGYVPRWPPSDQTSVPARFLMTADQKCLDVEMHCPLYTAQTYKNKIICAGNLKNSNNSACMGDSGGPLTFTDEKGEAVLLGVVSGPGDERQICIGVTIYGRVSSPNILQWIKKNIQDHD